MVSPGRFHCQGSEVRFLASGAPSPVFALTIVKLQLLAFDVGHFSLDGRIGRRLEGHENIVANKLGRHDEEGTMDLGSQHRKRILQGGMRG